jgi:hypothetical protein
MQLNHTRETLLAGKQESHIVAKTPTEQRFDGGLALLKADELSDLMKSRYDSSYAAADHHK